MRRIIPTLCAGLLLVAGAPVRAASLLCLIPGGHRAAPQMDGDVPDIELAVDPASLLGDDWRTWRVTGVWQVLFRRARATVSWDGAVVTIRSGLPARDAPANLLTIDTATGLAAVRMVSPFRDETLVWTGRCDPVA